MMPTAPAAALQECEECCGPCACHDPNAPDPEPQGLDLEGEALVDYLDSLTDQEREEIAGPWPVRWLYPWKPGQAERGINVCGGCGGGCAGLRLVLGVELDLICIDANKDATETSAAAGCNALVMDTRQIDPRHPALRGTRRAVFTMPCPDWSVAGVKFGHRPENIATLVEAIYDVSEAYGNVWRFGGHHGDLSTVEFGKPWDHVDVAEMWSWVDELTADKRTAGLMLAPVLIGMGLIAAGAPLESVIIEQAWTLPEAVKEAIAMEYIVAGWHGVRWDILDAGDFGSPSTRRRAIMTGARGRELEAIEAPGITTWASHAIGWGDETWINTRGVRKTSGGNEFKLGRVMPGITSKIRGWYDADDPERRFTIQEVCLLLALPADYPILAHRPPSSRPTSRTSQCRQLGDIFSPLVSAAVWGNLLELDWHTRLAQYLADLYPHIHRPPIPMDQGVTLLAA
ncbi:hypothetical protein [Streptomyces sp. NPDC001089]